MCAGIELADIFGVVINRMAVVSVRAGAYTFIPRSQRGGS